MTKIAKTVIAAVSVLCFALIICGCGKTHDITDTYITGAYEINFYDISALIPSKFIRDSTQSNNNLCVFEYGNYKEYIIITSSALTGDADEKLDEYAALMRSRGAESIRTADDKIKSVYTNDGVFCQEIMFIYDNSVYAFALRGGTEDEFQILIDNIKIKGTENT